MTEINISAGEIYNMTAKKFQVLIDVDGEKTIISSKDSLKDALKEAISWLDQNGYLEEDDMYHDEDFEPADFSGASDGDR